MKESEDQLELFDFDYSESKWRYYNESTRTY